MGMALPEGTEERQAKINRPTRKLVSSDRQPMAKTTTKTEGRPKLSIRGKAKRKQPTPGKMNKTEQRYAGELEIRRLAGDIHAWQFEPITFRLAKKTTYTPDFLIVHNDGTMEMVDVKGRKGSGPGGWEDDARVKIKLAADKFPWFAFSGAAWHKPKGSPGYFTQEVFH